MQINLMPSLDEERSSQESDPAAPPPRRRPVPEILLSALANVATKWTGSSFAFLAAVSAIAAWALLGPYFAYSDTWQLFINTGTSLVTFLMVFLIQRAQNKDSQAIHLKLNELIAAVNGASNRLINVERMGEHDLEALHQEFQKLLEHATQEASPTKKHTIEEATDLPVQNA
jgi:low affinity Fe/Cu permease